MKKRIIALTGFMLLLFAAFCIGDVRNVSADESASEVSIGATDYENLVMTIYPNGNSIVYMSTDNRKTWNEVEGNVNTDQSGKAYIDMDISWASPTSNVKLYFKGNTVKTEMNCVLPKQDSSFKVKFDKVTGDFEMTTGSGATTFWWRKSTDYSWKEVDFDTASESYKSFLSTVESLRFKGAKLVFRTGQTAGQDAQNMGTRPSKEVAVSVNKFSAAPSIKLNLVKLTLNTKNTMEYTLDINSGSWHSCEKAMGLDEIAPQVFASGSADATDVTVYFRVAQTGKKAASLVNSIKFPAQTAGPVVGAENSDITCTENTDKGKYDLIFNTASSTNMIEYCVVSPDKTFELTKAKWKSVKASKTVSLSKKAAPEDSVIYFRFKGTNENAAKGTKFMLPSAYVTYTVKWTPESSGQ